MVFREGIGLDHVLSHLIHGKNRKFYYAYLQYTKCVLPWNNNNKSSTEEIVKKIIDNFWQRFANLDEQTMALRTLKLKADANRHEITRSYRELIARHHPDKGGDSDTFIHIRQAYELLR